MAPWQTLKTLARQFRHVSTIKPILFLIAFLFLILPASAQKAEQNCTGDDCVQVVQNTGVINIEGGKVQIAVNNGVVNIRYVGDPKDKEKIKNYDVKIANLTEQIKNHLITITQQKKYRLSDQEKVFEAAEYAKGLVEQIDQLNERIAKLDEQHELTIKIKAARDRYDVPLIKQLLKKKQQLDDKNSAETAFQLAGFQKLDLEYTEAYANYQKAVYLDSTNSLYLNEAGLMAIILGKYKEAVKLINVALAGDLKTYGEGYPIVATRRNNLGGAWKDLGEYKKAIGYFELTLATFNRVLGKDHPNTRETLNYLNITKTKLAQKNK